MGSGSAAQDVSARHPKAVFPAQASLGREVHQAGQGRIVHLPARASATDYPQTELYQDDAQQALDAKAPQPI